MATSRYGLETALYNLDQSVVLGIGAGIHQEDEWTSAEAEAAFKAGLKRGAVEALAMSLGFKHNMNEVWQSQPLTLKRGQYGRYEEDDYGY